MIPPIRPAVQGDAEAIDALLLDAFGGPEEGALVRRLRADGLARVELVAEGISGHILLGALDAVAGGRPLPALALAPLAVRPERQGDGIGSALVRAALERAGAATVFVLGAPEYYGRFGFSAEAAAAFKAPFGPPNFMALALVPGALDVRAGRVTYPAAFGL